MEIKPSRFAPLLWFFEKGPFFATVCIVCLFSILSSFSSLPYVESIGCEGIYLLGAIFFMFPVSMLFLEYKKKRYYILKSYVHIRDGFRTRKMKFDEIDDVKIRQGFTERIFGLSDVVITGKKGRFVFEAIENPKEVDRELKQKVFGS